MNTYVRDGQKKRKWHIARTVAGRAVLPGEYTPTLCNRSLKAREFTQDRHETNRTGLCYQCRPKGGGRLTTYIRDSIFSDWHIALPADASPVTRTGTTLCGEKVTSGRHVAYDKQEAVQGGVCRQCSDADEPKEGGSTAVTDTQQTALVRRYDFEDEEGQTLSVCLRKAADFVEQYEGGIMDMTLTMDTNGPVVSLFTDDLPDTEGALIEQANATEALLFKVAQRLESQPDMREQVLAQRQRLTTAAMLSKEARRG